ncbi:MAG: SBBP repeat-containing protein [Candidatus Sumerlaeota bacterium]|nr:SBBP repeat-containing protein [Candidatus Sumerlaeota bacterium]
MIRAKLFFQVVVLVTTVACGAAMAQERSGARREMGAPAVQPASAKSAAAPVMAYNLQFSTYFGGSNGELLRDMTVDAQGNIYVAGSTASPDFPRTAGAIAGESKNAGGSLVAKFSPAGALVWSKVIGGEYFYSVKVDGAGNVFVAGRMRPGFPTTPGAFQPTTAHNCGFVGKLKPDASGWVWNSYVGTGYAVRDMTMDDKGDLYCVLDYYTSSKEVLPVEWFARAFSKTPHGGGDHFGKCDAGVIKISNDGKVIWATWIGGSNGNDWVASLGVGADRCPVALLRTYSKDMPITPEAYSKVQSEGWLGKLSADGSSLIFGTYIADAFPRTHNVAVDRQGNIFLCTCTKKWPVTPGAFQTKFGGGPEDFGVAKFSPDGKLLAATYLGGNGDEINGPDQIAVDDKGRVVIAGSSSATDYPVTQGAFQPRNAGAGGKYPYDGVVSVLSNDLSALIYSSYIGGSGDDMARACCLGSDGALYVGGVATSKDFPTKNAIQTKYGGDPGFGSTPGGGRFPAGWGNGDCWLAKFQPAPAERAANR